MLVLHGLCHQEDKPTILYLDPWLVSHKEKKCPFRRSWSLCLSCSSVSLLECPRQGAMAGCLWRGAGISVSSGLFGLGSFPSNSRLSRRKALGQTCDWRASHPLQKS